MSPRHTPRSPLDAGAWNLLAFLGVLLIAALLSMVWQAQQTTMTWALGIFLVAGTAILLLKVPSLFRFLLVLSALLNGAGGTFGWFEDYAWFDEFVHAYSGFAGLSAIGLLYARDVRRTRAHLVWWCTGMGLALGIGWEMVEGMMGELGFMDTVSDLVMDTIGAALGGLFAWHALRIVQPAQRMERAGATRGRNDLPVNAPERKA
ncbi:hypothetical protein WG922_07940 [Ramlibacter sp. AN1015]|uniref:hypothetical protein n=1 Tax=Ramlibacter sp. AN1015 TaxID=3133428 RepID=UPI0030C2C34C